MLGIIDQSYLFDLLEALVQRDGAKLLSLADEMEAQCLSFDSALQDLAALLHRIALSQTVPQTISEDIPEYARIFTLAKIFTPDDIQLFYQIALHGRSDLNQAPDEYAGFTMTLMRMLTFMPDDWATSDQPLQVPVIASRPSAKVDNAPQVKPEQTLQHSSHNANVDSSGLDWLQLIQQLKLTGMAKMLAQHSEAKVLSAENIELCVPDVHKHLLDKKYQDKIQTALNTYFGKPIVLNFSVGSITGLTPAALRQREEQEKQAQAIEAIEKDLIVQELIEQFDAKLIVPSIKPIQK
jgi:DNA polymerase-3 subunit gamma/tau